MRVCRQLYIECKAVIFTPSRAFVARLGRSSLFELELLNTWKLLNSATRACNKQYRLTKQLRSMKSLKLQLPSPCRSYCNLRNSLNIITNLMLSSAEQNGSAGGLKRLTIDFENKWNHPRFKNGLVTQDYSPRPAALPGKSGEAHHLLQWQPVFKWVLAPLERLYGLEPGHVRVLIGGNGELRILAATVSSSC